MKRFITNEPHGDLIELGKNENSILRYWYGILEFQGLNDMVRTTRSSIKTTIKPVFLRTNLMVKLKGGKLEIL